jgi:hypothetical protein
MKQDIPSYLRERSRKDPYFAVMTLAIHGGSVPYSRSQEFVEQLVVDGAHKNLDFDFVMRTLGGNPDEPYSPTVVGKSYLYPRSAAKKVVLLTECYLNACGIDGKDCLEPESRNELNRCAEKVSGAGVKGRALMMQYLGDNRVMPIDRHIIRFLCEIDEKDELQCPTEIWGEISEKDDDMIWIKTFRDFHRQWGRMPDDEDIMIVGRQRDKKLPFQKVYQNRVVQRIDDTRQEFIDDNYGKIEAFLHEKANSCGYDPVQFHNAAWLYNVCAS